MFSGQVSAEITGDFRDQMKFLPLVDIHDGVEDPEVVAYLTGAFHEGLDIFGEAAAAITNAREEKSLTDPVITADAAADHIHISTEAFAELGDLVHEGDLGREEGVSGVFCQFRRALIHENDRIT